MELIVQLTFLLLFASATITLCIIYKYGNKKKTYDEALAEHRKKTSALREGIKPKLKEKKKKAAKKQRALSTNSEELNKSDSYQSEGINKIQQGNGEKLNQEIVSKNEKIKIAAGKGNKVHVDFKDEPEEVPVEPTVEKEAKEVTSKKRPKKTKPILIKRPSEAEITIPSQIEAPVTNRFEKIHPKDDLELRRSLSKDDVGKEEKKSEKVSKKSNKQLRGVEKVTQQEIAAEKKGVGIVEPGNEINKPEEEKAIEIVASIVNVAGISTTKEKKKKKSDPNAKQSPTAERDQLIHTLRNAELTRTEVQLLIDLLLNKQLEAPAIINDWSEGKSDPIQKLKKQLAEKEKQLVDEQEALIAVQAKLREVRNQQLAERTQMVQKLKATEEDQVRLLAIASEFEEYKKKDVSNVQRCFEENHNLKMQLVETDTLIVNLKTENTRLTAQLALLTQDGQEQINNLLKQNEDLRNKLCAANDYFKEREGQLTSALTQQQEEKEQLQHTIETYVKEEQTLKDNLQQLKTENQILLKDKDSQKGGHQLQEEKLTKELFDIKSALESTSQSLIDTEKKYMQQLGITKEEHERVLALLREEESKNDELRKKNWKVMEALNAAENRNKQQANKISEIDVEKIIQDVKRKEHDAQKEFIERLFPEVETLKGKTNSCDWQDEYERSIRQYVARLQHEVNVHSKTIRLQKEAQETTLRELQMKIAHEEQKWIDKFRKMEGEIRELTVKNQNLSQLEVQVLTLEEKLKENETKYKELLHERLNTTEVKKVTDVDKSFETIEKISEENARLQDELAKENPRNGQEVYQNGSLKSSNSTDSEPLIEGETS